MEKGSRRGAPEAASATPPRAPGGAGPWGRGTQKGGRAEKRAGDRGGPHVGHTGAAAPRRFTRADRHRASSGGCGSGAGGRGSGRAGPRERLRAASRWRRLDRVDCVDGHEHLARTAFTPHHRRHRQNGRRRQAVLADATDEDRWRRLRLPVMGVYMPAVCVRAVHRCRVDLVVIVGVIVAVRVVSADVMIADEIVIVTVVAVVIVRVVMRVAVPMRFGRWSVGICCVVRRGAVLDQPPPVPGRRRARQQHVPRDDERQHGPAHRPGERREVGRRRACAASAAARTSGMGHAAKVRGDCAAQDCA